MNKYLLIPLFTLVMCQLIKVVIESIKEKKFKVGRFFNGTGGMPSSHSAFTFSLTFTILFSEGATPLFAVALIFSIIVAYDAMGLRRESGLQAQAINLILDEMVEENMIEGFNKLKEQLGHKPFEVLMGIVLALITSFCFK